MSLRELARRPHPCAPWLELDPLARERLFPGGIGEDPTLLRARAEHLAGRGFELPILGTERTATWAASTRSAWERIRGGAPVVLTGQQPVLAGGPFFVWLKAAGAIAAARRASRILGRDVVPLFWIAGDDSDLDEVRSQPDPLRKASLQAGFGPVPAGTPVGPLPFPPQERERLVQEMERLWPATRAAHLMRTSRDLSEALRRSLEAWFPGTELAVVDGSWPEVRAAMATGYARFARHPETVAAALEQGIAAAQGAGLPVSLRNLPGKLRLFSLQDGIRRRLDAPADPEALAQAILSDPGAYSHDAASRILATESAFPVLAHVLGPGEFGYVACLGRLQERLGQVIAPALARPSLTLLPSDLVALAKDCGHPLSSCCPASPRPLEVGISRHRHPETLALGRSWKVHRLAYLRALGEADGGALGRRLEGLEEERLQRRLLEALREDALLGRRVRGLWSWLGAGGLQERAVPAWSLEQSLGRKALEQVFARLLEGDEPAHAVLEVPC